MNLSIEFGNEHEDIINKEETEIIKKYIEKYDCNNYEEKFTDNITVNEVKYLSSQSQNILNWYPFNRECSILEIGGNLGQLTQLFCSKCKSVTTIESNLSKAKAIAKRCKDYKNLDIVVGDLKDIKLSKKYDIITLIGISKNLKIDEIIKNIEVYLKPEGKILLAVDNKFGLRFFAGNPENILNKKFESLIGYNNEAQKIETYTKSSLENQLRQLGYNTRFYYPLPDFRIPNVIFTDEQLPKYNSIDKYNPYYTDKSDILMNEIDVFREILKTDENMFTFFTNSFLVEITKGKCNEEYKYISFNNLRKEEYRLITKIAENYVEKQIVNEKAKDHYQTIKDNINILQKNGIKILEYIEDKKIKSKYIEQKYLLNNVLTEKLEEGNEEEFYEILNNYIEVIKVNCYKETDYNKTIFGKYKIDIRDNTIIEKMHFLKDGLWDMTFKNCFLIQNEFYFFDQEWNEPNLPAEYILYRAIFYTISLRRFIKIDDLFEKYNISQYIEIFRKLDDKLQEKVRDNRMWNFYGQDRRIDIDATKQEIVNLNIRSSAQENAMKIIQMENENLKTINKELQENIDKTLSNRLKKRIKRIIGGNNGQKD